MNGGKVTMGIQQSSNPPSRHGRISPGSGSASSNRVVRTAGNGTGAAQDVTSGDAVKCFLNRQGFVIGDHLGEGSYSKVRLCTRYSTSDGSYMYKLACKIIDKRKASGDFVEKFLPRELHILRQLNHPQIVRVWDSVQLRDHVIILMDYCDGGDLLEYIKQVGIISESRGRLFFRQLVGAIQYLHNKDIAHRDLKCENVLLSGNGQSVKLSDFGFSRYCRNGEGKRILSETYCGSAAYAAPEILQGLPYNPKLFDVWALGCILFIMLTGHMPFDESDIPRMLKCQQEQILIYPNKLEEQLSICSKILIKRLLEPDVTRRGNIEHAATHEWTRNYRSSSSQGRHGAAGDYPLVDNPSLQSPRNGQGRNRNGFPDNSSSRSYVIENAQVVPSEIQSPRLMSWNNFERYPLGSNRIPRQTTAIGHTGGHPGKYSDFSTAPIPTRTQTSGSPRRR